MFALKPILLFICAIFALSESKFVETLSKCSINDFDCHKALVSSSLKAIHKTGIPELGIPPIDPFEFQDLSISVLDLFELKAVEGKAKGVKDCVVDSFITEIEKGHSELKLTCSLSIKAKYSVSGSSPLLKNLLGGQTVKGEGNGKVRIENIQMKFIYNYDVLRNKDGDIIFNCRFNETDYDYKILGKVTFAADKILLGDTDATQLVVQFINDNARFVMSSFSKPFVDKAVEIIHENSRKFFNVVPAKYYIIEDLSQYVKN